MLTFWILAAALMAVVMGVLMRALWAGGVARRRLPLLVVGVCLPTAVVGLYLGYGYPQLAGMGHGEKAVDALTRQLEQRLARQPADAPGWLELARLQLLRERHSLAVQAARNAHRLRDGHPETMATYAYALYRMHGRAQVPAGDALLQRVAAATPGPALALWVAGLAALERGDLSAARVHWDGWAALQAEPGPHSAPRAARPVAEAVPAVEPIALTVEVSVAEELMDSVGSTHVLYVYARDPAGPPMPIAALRVQPTTWPVSVILDDTATLRPGLRLGQYSEVLVGAHISRSGEAMAQSGDLLAEPVKAAPSSDEPVRARITRRVP